MQSRMAVCGWIVVEQQSLEPRMYWGVRGAESAGFEPKADGEAWGGGSSVMSSYRLSTTGGRMLVRTGKPRWE